MAIIIIIAVTFIVTALIVGTYLVTEAITGSTSAAVIAALVATLVVTYFLFKTAKVTPAVLGGILGIILAWMLIAGDLFSTPNAATAVISSRPATAEEKQKLIDSFDVVTNNNLRIEAKDFQEDNFTEVYIVENEDFHALAVHGGSLYVKQSFIENGSDEEIASGLSHEHRHRSDEGENKDTSKMFRIRPIEAECEAFAMQIYFERKYLGEGKGIGEDDLVERFKSLGGSETDLRAKASNEGEMHKLILETYPGMAGEN